MAERVEGGYRVNGRKVFCTNSSIATNFSFTARYEDEDAGPRVGIFRASRETAPGFSFVETWDTLGMRGTQSNDLVIEDAFVPDEALIHSVPFHHFDARVLKTVFLMGDAHIRRRLSRNRAGAMEWAKTAIVSEVDSPIG